MCSVWLFFFFPWQNRGASCCRWCCGSSRRTCRSRRTWWCARASSPACCPSSRRRKTERRLVAQNVTLLRVFERTQWDWGGEEEKGKRSRLRHEAVINVQSCRLKLVGVPSERVSVGPAAAEKHCCFFWQRCCELCNIPLSKKYMHMSCWPTSPVASCCYAVGLSSSLFFHKSGSRSCV